MLRNVTFKLLLEIGQLLTRLPNIIENCFVILMQILRRKSLRLRMQEQILAVHSLWLYHDFPHTLCSGWDKGL